MIEVRPVQYVQGVEPKPKILLINHWLQFSNRFPDSLNHVRGKVARIAKQQQVPYELSYTIKEGCYYDVDLSNESGENLYPDASENLYEMLIGFKPGNFFCQVYFPADYPLYRLDDPDMSPLISSNTYKYLGAIKPSDSPDDNPTMKLYLVYKLKPIYLRLVVDEGIDYEKMTLKLLINRCVMDFSKPLPAGIAAKQILYLDEISEMRAVTG